MASPVTVWSALVPEAEPVPVVVPVPVVLPPMVPVDTFDGFDRFRYASTPAAAPSETATSATVEATQLRADFRGFDVYGLELCKSVFQCVFECFRGVRCAAHVCNACTLCSNGLVNQRRFNSVRCAGIAEVRKGDRSDLAVGLGNRNLHVAEGVAEQTAGLSDSGRGGRS